VRRVPPRARTASLETLRAAFDAQAALVVGALAEADRGADTRCAGWTVAELDRHLGAIVTRLTWLIAHPCAEAADTSVAQWAERLPGLAALADEDARTAGPGLAEAVPALQEALATASPSTVVEQRTGRHPLADALLFRVLELVVHGRDLPEPVPPDRAALKLAVWTLADLLAERAPGRHVEVRVPPYAAVQCVEGPRHTRGTPPNVVEADPVAFVELCAGRLPWSDAARDGRVRTWGDRADLSPWLPLLA
jgi:uncharacterized protein (TIGR03083 family)